MPTPTEFLQSLVLVPVTLLPIINPLAGAPVFSLTAGPERAARASSRARWRSTAGSSWWARC
jgi:hypothetical protein